MRKKESTTGKYTMKNYLAVETKRESFYKTYSGGAVNGIYSGEGIHGSEIHLFNPLKGKICHKVS